MGEIRYLHREKGTIENELVYGDRWLRLVYENPVGKPILWTLAKRAWFSRWYGRRMDKNSSKAKIKPFIAKYNLNEDEFETKPENFNSFNDFFSRKLKLSARPITQDEKSAVFPADGRHLGFPCISTTDGIFVKGQKFNLPELFQSKELSKPYFNGSIVLSRLCPVDYHRFHFPVDGIISDNSLLNGSLFSVNPIALRKNLGIVWHNKRYLSFLDTKKFGKVAQFLIGATFVGSVTITCPFQKEVKKGDEFGFFSFGGSSVLTLFEKGRIKLSEDLVSSSRKGMEMYAKVGDEMGQMN